ncbi:prolipoprotein diacylglyceryl transferase [Aliikangiella maris]|uniref:Prolipoprotein diacylglyceryl transferase family protein n=2 Tax=Aliikangiella maris TaxID=3162458 RepID=A0ABV3MM54_9GAMM
MFPYLYQSTALTIGTYGVMLALAYLVGRHIYIAELNRIDKNINVEIFILSLLIVGVIGAKLMFLFKNPDKGSLTQLSSLTSATGFSSQGAILGAIIVTVIFSKINQIKLNLLLDSAAPAAIVAYAIARVGCFLSGDDCHGIESDLPWAMTFPNGLSKTEVPVHPVPLYEVIYSIFIWLYLLHSKKKPLRPYQLFFTFIFLWGVCRFLVEFVAANPIKIIGMSGSQFGALLMFISGSIYFFRLYLNQATKKKPG